MFRRFQKAAPEGPEAADYSLALALPGQKVRITGYQGGRMLRARLLALGRGISQKILAEPEA